jgi:hypothetical protein
MIVENLRYILIEREFSKNNKKMGCAVIMSKLWCPYGG